MLNKKALSATAQVEKDGDFKNTVLLLHGDGTNGAQNNTFTDSSTNNFTITRNGNTTQGTFSPFSVAAGEWSNYFDGTGDYLSFANGTFNLGSNDFVIESFFYVTSSGGYYTIAGGNTDLATQTGSSWNVTINNTGTISGTAYSGSTLYQITTTATVSQNVWNHVVFVRTGGTISLFLNGTKDGTNTTLSTASINNGSTTYPPCVGANGTANVFLGYLSNTRIIIGSNSSNVYSASASSITVPTAPLTAVTDTKVLTCRSNRFVDISNSPNTVTPNGNTSVQAFSPFAPTAAYSAGTNGGSGYFDGTDDCLDVATTTLNPRTDSFTTEGWFYVTSTSGNRTLVGSTSNSLFYIGYLPGTTLFAVGDGTTNTIEVTVSALPYSWNYFAISFDGTTYRAYINGTRVQESTTLLASNSVNLTVGARNSGSFRMLGYLSDVRHVKGSALYTGSTMTVPTAPLSTVSGTEFLLKFQGAGIIDSTAKNVLETVDNAQIDTTTKKFGTGSLEFDGTGDYLLCQTNGLQNFGTGDFTVEAWVYITSTTNNNNIVDARSAVAGEPWIFQVTSGGSPKLAFYDGSNTLETTTTVSTNQWVHVAACRSGSTLKLFINGTSGYSNTNTTDLKNTGTILTVGSRVTGGANLFTGYIDDLRITKGIARYTANFTAPTKAFPDQ